MKRDIAALVEHEFDLVVIGAGVYGAATAWDASLRGLSVALIDKSDFGSGTSFNNLKTIHGGLRYLQHADFKRMRESVRERGILMRIAPHLVHPLPFLVPTYRGSLSRSRTAMRAALWLNDLVSWDRNRGADPQKHLPAGEALSRAECLERAPGIDPRNLTGAVLWYDAQMHNSDRMTLSLVMSAAEQGAVVANFVEATELLRTGGSVVGVRARDVVSGEDALEIRAKLVVNASGPWLDALTGCEPKLFHFSKALNLVTRRIASDIAIGVTSRRPHRDRDAILDKILNTEGGRFLCLIPWRDVTLVGTAHAPYTGTPDGLEATEEDIRDLLDDVNEAYPDAKLAREDVRLVHRGLLPMVSETGNGTGITLVKSYALDTRVPGLLSILGVKYTTARDVAEKAVDRAMTLIGKNHVPSRSAETPVVGGDIERFDEFLAEARGDVPREVLRHLVYTYGSRYPEILKGDPEPVVAGSVVVAAEIRHAVRDEMAIDLASVVLRRTELGTAGHPGRAVVDACADIIQSELGWSEQKKATEIETLEAFYRRRS
jgi:glycerol-3-phosphate dehydrogenase